MAAEVTLDGSIPFLTQAILLFTSIWTIIDFLRNRGRERAAIAAMFSSLGITTLVDWSGALGLQSPWSSNLAVAAVLAHPLLMLLVVHHFRRVPIWVLAIAASGWGVSVVLLLAAGGPDQALLSSTAALAIIAPFAFGETYAACALVAGAVKSRGIAHRRLAFAAVGTGLLALIIILAGVDALLRSASRLPAAATDMVALFCISAFYLGFSPPKWLRRLWLQAEIARFTVEQGASGNAMERAAVTTEILAETARSLVSGRQAWVALAPPPHWRLHGRTRTGAHTDTVPDGAEAKTLASLLEAEGSSRLIATGHLPPNGSELLAPRGTQHLLAIPLRSQTRAWGVALVTLERPPLFLGETLQVLETLAAQASIAYEVEAAETEIKAANKELEAFAYSVSHDLRAPLRAMGGFARILLDDHGRTLPAEARHHVDIIVDSSREMGQMVDDLLRFSRLGKQDLNLEDVDVEALAKSVSLEATAGQEARNIDFRIGKVPSCRADRALLKQVLANLLGNAVKYTRDRQRAQVELGWTDADGGAYYVKDNGVGFDMKHAGNLFGVFQRLHRAEDYEGTGVGLAIVQRIVLRHQGRIWAEAEPDQGATFHFTIHGGPT